MEVGTSAWTLDDFHLQFGVLRPNPGGELPAIEAADHPQFEQFGKSAWTVVARVLARTVWLSRLAAGFAGRTFAEMVMQPDQKAVLLHCGNVSGRSRPAKAGRMKTSHFEERIALDAVEPSTPAPAFWCPSLPAPSASSPQIPQNNYQNHS